MGMVCSSRKCALLAFGASLVLASSMLTNEASVAFAFVTPSPSSLPNRMLVLRAETNDECSDSNNNIVVARRSVLQSAAMFAAATLTSPLPSHALVKGNAPPPKSSPPGSSSEKKCRNVEECQEQAEILAQQKLEEEMANATPPKVAPGGSRYKDIVEVVGGGSSEGEEGSGGIRVAKAGDTVELRYKVLKLGKRSYDGLSGEGTVVFSRGYGLEDDEKKPGDTSFITTLGSPSLVAAISDGVLGMAPGSIRRISILPQMGWRLPGKQCDGGPGGSGAGGELKTDYVVVPTATMVNEETCFDKTKLPFPQRYDQQRRLAQRFDQSLIIEVELVAFS
uniref:Peptidylprolyl isomerase n=1 Tax=Minutocellus polymorphus TaxID=265543 RepID=A0A7S0ANI2_9STRA|mmetsp:Transcript_17747/g.29503  ORF Transcript_17747/g.29503 Transcript_17747/m.29503 type:complete len:336 (+) Transcript_17747:136-1143(+)